MTVRSQQDSGHTDVHRDPPILEGGGDEATEGEHRHDAQGEGEQRVGSGQNRIHLCNLRKPTRTEPKHSASSSSLQMNRNPKLIQSLKFFLSGFSK